MEALCFWGQAYLAEGLGVMMQCGAAEPLLKHRGMGRRSPCSTQDTGRWWLTYVPAARALTHTSAEPTGAGRAPLAGLPPPA